LESAAQDDDFQEIKRRKWRFSNNTSKTTMKSTKSVPISTTVKLPPKAVPTRNFFTPLRANDIDMETTGTEKTPPEQKTPRKSGRPTPIVMTSTTNLIRLQSDLKEHVKGDYEFRNAKTLAMSGPIASNPLDVCGVVVGTCIRNAPKIEYRIYADLLQLHPSRRRGTSSSVILRMQPLERRTAEEKSKASSQGTLWEEFLL
jgi:hypothetical protein